MMKIIFDHGQMRVVQTFSPPHHEMTGFLACKSEPARHFQLHSQVNVFAIPGNCAFDVKTASKLKSLPQAQGLSLNQDFLWILAFNVSQYHRSHRDVDRTVFYGRCYLPVFPHCSVIRFQIQKKLPFFKKKQETFQRSYKTYNRPSISYPHPGARSLDNLTSSEETLTSHLTNPRILGNNPFLTPARLRDQRFQGYQATIRRPSYRPQSVQVDVVQVDVHQPDQVVPTGKNVEKMEESRI